MPSQYRADTWKKNKKQNLQIGFPKHDNSHKIYMVLLLMNSEAAAESNNGKFRMIRDRSLDQLQLKYLTFYFYYFNIFY